MHYNMPPFCHAVKPVRVGSPKRREIGHGRLAKRALKAVLPSAEGFHYIDSRGFRNLRIKRLLLDGLRLRRLPVDA